MGTPAEEARALSHPRQETPRRRVCAWTEVVSSGRVWQQAARRMHAAGTHASRTVVQHSSEATSTAARRMHAAGTHASRTVVQHSSEATSTAARRMHAAGTHARRTVVRHSSEATSTVRLVHHCCAAPLHATSVGALRLPPLATRPPLAFQCHSTTAHVH